MDIANTFEDAVLTTGELCHFLGREFVCVVFTWPAGGTKGVFFGYDVDRESAEFAVEDLKKTIRMIAETPGVQKIHLLAHSRGTDLLATAVSDLSVEAYVSRSSIARKFKIGNIALMAPDLDFDVAFSKIWKVVSDPDLPYGDAPRPDVVVPSPEFHITVYVSPNDKALATVRLAVRKPGTRRSCRREHGASGGHRAGTCLERIRRDPGHGVELLHLS